LFDKTLPRLAGAPFQCRFTGNQLDFSLVDLDANLTDQLANDGPRSSRIGRVEGVGQTALQASVRRTFEAESKSSLAFW